MQAYMFILYLVVIHNEEKRSGRHDLGKRTYEIIHREEKKHDEKS